MAVVHGEAYLEVSAQRAHWDEDRVRSLKLRKLTHRRPTRIDGDSVVIKVRVAIDDGYFNRTAQATIEIDEADIQPLITTHEAWGA